MEVGKVVFNHDVFAGFPDCAKCDLGYDGCKLCKGTDPLQTPQVVLLGRILDSLGRIEAILKGGV
jgi:hypothetical protein